MFDFLLRPIRRHFGIDKEYYRFIDDMFGFIPNNIELYKLALIHKSASQSIGGLSMNNERLEFLGDAVIECVTSDYLYIEFPDRNEGFLTQLRSKIVSRQSLNDMAHEIGLDKYVITGSNGGGLVQKHIYGDAFEAMVGAIYLDQGYDFVNRLLINNIFYKHLNLEYLTESETDFKSRLIEWCQKNHHNVSFRTRSGNDSHASAPVFNSTVMIDSMAVGYGTGDSKKTAEQNAACSVTREISDEDCVELLDKLDRLEAEAVRRDRKTATESSPKGNKPADDASEKRNRRRRHSRKRQTDAVQPDVAPTGNEPQVVVAGVVPAVEPEVVTETISAEVVAAEVERPKRRRGNVSRSRRRDENAVAEADQFVEHQPVPETETADVTQAEETVAVKRPSRRRSSRALQAETEQPSAANDSTAVDDAVATDAVSQEGIPAERSRSRRRRTPAAVRNAEDLNTPVQQAEGSVETV